jgi:tetratricopeptide (TPR) repeat protein
MLLTMANEPFLPPAEPTDNPPQKRRMKPLLLWMLLVLGFLSVYNLYNSDIGGSGALTQLFVNLSGFLARGWPVLAGLAFLGLVAWQLGGAARFNASLEPGFLALQAGNTGRAVQAFEIVLARYRRQLFFAALARIHLASALKHREELDRAIEILRQVERTPGMAYPSDVRLLGSIELGEIYALRGDVETAGRWLADAERRLARAENRLLAGARLRIAQVVLLVRRGEDGEAMRLIEQHRAHIESIVPLTTMRVIWLLQAFVTARGGDTRAAGEVFAILRQIRPHELDYLSVEWPELRMFLQTSK